MILRKNTSTSRSDAVSKAEASRRKSMPRSARRAISSLARRTTKDARDLLTPRVSRSDRRTRTSPHPQHNKAIASARQEARRGILCGSRRKRQATNRARIAAAQQRVDKPPARLPRAACRRNSVRNRADEPESTAGNRTAIRHRPSNWRRFTKGCGRQWQLYFG